MLTDDCKEECQNHMLGGFNWDHSLGINWAWVPLTRSTNLYGLEGPVTEIYNFDSG